MDMDRNMKAERSMSHSDKYSEPPKLLGKLFKWLRVFFVIYLVGEVSIGLGLSLIYNSGSYMFGPDLPFTLGDGIYEIGGLIMLLGFIGSVIIFSIFSYRATKNLHKFGVKYFELSPGWSVGWYFIPIANLWKPYGYMTDIWSSSQPEDAKSWEMPKTMPIWWVCWVISNITSNISFRMGLKSGYMDAYAHDVPLYKTSLYFEAASSVTGIIAALCILSILKKITYLQDTRAQVDVFD